VIELIEGQLDGRGERSVVLRSDDVRFDGRVKLRLRVPRERR
jgi:hypothetical protein